MVVDLDMVSVKNMESRGRNTGQVMGTRGTAVAVAIRARNAETRHTAREATASRSNMGLDVKSMEAVRAATMKVTAHAKGMGVVVTAMETGVMMMRVGMARAKDTRNDDMAMMVTGITRDTKHSDPMTLMMIRHTKDGKHEHMPASSWLLLPNPLFPRIYQSQLRTDIMIPTPSSNIQHPISFAVKHKTAGPETCQRHQRLHL